MKKAKIAKIKKAGYRVTDTKKFLGLSEAEVVLLDLKIALTSYLREVRRLKNVSQSELAKRLGSSQSRVAKLEAAKSDVSLDLIFKALLELGESRKSLGKVFSKGEH